MIVGFFGMIVVIAVAIALPVALYAAVRAIRGVTSSTLLDAGETEERLRRMEDAIEAMAHQIEQLRDETRYVSARKEPQVLLEKDSSTDS